MTLLALWSFCVCGLLAFSGWVERREILRARQFISDCHGDLPPAETLHGESLTFLLEVMPYYLKRDDTKCLTCPANNISQR